ncbi:MAG: efflux RND transporter periplasmic adaptor subunit [Rhodopseudomonas sp.]|nr:efflux RND transporter periplasmic adaptor subunit [Rhodopseudomonas sp.]
MRNYFIIALALVGVAVAAFAVVQDDRAASVAGAPSPTALSPFSSYVEGTGITEASTGNIAIGTPVPGIVTAVDVSWGEEVKAGAPLFTIDDTDVKAQLLPAQAAVAQAEADLAKNKNLLDIGTNLAVGTSISKVEVENRRYDVAIKQAALAAARAKVKQLDSELSRHTVRAPVDGRVLQINTRVGEYAPSGVLNPPLMLFGDDRLIYLRVSIDEDDAWRVRPDAQAIAFLRGNPDLKTPLNFVRFDPYLVPKTLLTGNTTERTDVRVLHVVYSFRRSKLPIYLGQEMDAFIKAPPVRENTAASAPEP